MKVSGSDGDIAVASNIWLDFDFGPCVMNWNSLNGFSEGFYDVLILGNSVKFQFGKSTALFKLTIVDGTHPESEEMLDLTA